MKQNLLRPTLVLHLKDGVPLPSISFDEGKTHTRIAEVEDIFWENFFEKLGELMYHLMAYRPTSLLVIAFVDLEHLHPIEMAMSNGTGVMLFAREHTLHAVSGTKPAVSWNYAEVLNNVPWFWENLKEQFYQPQLGGVSGPFEPDETLLGLYLIALDFGES